MIFSTRPEFHSTNYSFSKLLLPLCYRDTLLDSKSLPLKISHCPPSLYAKAENIMRNLVE